MAQSCAHSLKNNQDRIENYMVELPITRLALKFWKLYGGVGGSPASVQMNKNTSIRDMYGERKFIALQTGPCDGGYQIIQLREKPAVMWE